jgi:WD40 repeat protein
MEWSFNKQGRYARVFISYSRDDGEESAGDLRTRLEAEGIPIWQDRIGMEGGRDWWLQIVEALNHVEFMVLVMTSAALQSALVRKEWRYARQQGVCVYPVLASRQLDLSHLPRWMRSTHFYDLDHEWPKFVNDLNSHCQQVRVPFMVEDLPDDLVSRPQEFEWLLNTILDEQREEPIANTVALLGAGGYGKTTITKALCHNERVQEAFDDGILWVKLGEKPASLIGKVEDLIFMLIHERPGFATIDAATAYFAELLDDRDILLVVDDVWNEVHLKPFLQGGTHCTRLITTRDERVPPRNSQRIQVGAMGEQEAVDLLATGLEGSVHSVSDRQALHRLAARLGKWALLLKLVNRALLEWIRRGESLPSAMEDVNRILDEKGLTGFDAQNSDERSQAVAKTLEVSFELLRPEEYIRYRKLAVFPENTDIPLTTIQRLWSATSQLDYLGTKSLCLYLFDLSLLSHCDLVKRTIRLHDVIRTYLQYEVGAVGLVAFHQQLLDAYDCPRWAELPRDEPYMWEHLAEHLIGAGRGEELVATVKDGGYLAAKTHVRSVYAMETDLDMAMKPAPTDASLRLLKRDLARVSHLLNRCKTLHEVAGVLDSRLSRLSELSNVRITLEEDLPRPFLTSWHAFVDLSHAALIRTLEGHTDWVKGCAFDPLGDFIVSASFDETLKVWDAQTGAELHTLKGHTFKVNGCAVDPLGDFIVSASSDETLKVWDAQTRTESHALTGHTGEVYGCAVSPLGDFIVSASSDETLKVWDAQTRTELHILTNHTDIVNGCTVDPLGDFIVSASSDETLKVWDAHTGVLRLTLTGHARGVYGCAVSPNGNWIVSASADNTLKVWDAHTGSQLRTLTGHTDGVYGCAVSPDGNWIVSASYDKTLKVWDAYTGDVRLTLTGHTDGVYGCAVSPDGNWIVSASYDKTLKMWNAQGEAEILTMAGHKDRVNGCAVSPLGDYIVSASADGTLKVWDAQQGTEHLNLVGHTNWVRACAVSPNGNWIVSASDDETLKVWDTETGDLRLTLTGHTGGVNGCAVSPDGNWIVSASDDKTLKVWDVQTGDARLALQGHTDWVYGCVVSPSGDFIVSSSDDKTLKVWDARTGTERLTLTGHTGGVYGCAVSPDGNWIVSASYDKTLKVWDAYTGNIRLTLSDHKDRVNGCAVSPLGSYIVSASADETLKVWDAQEGACLMTLHVDGELQACAFCPDGIHLVAGGEGGIYFLKLITNGATSTLSSPRKGRLSHFLASLRLIRLKLERYFLRFTQSVISING